MTQEQARESLKHLAVRYILQDGNRWTICIGNCGRKFDANRRFAGVDLGKLVAKVVEHFEHV